MWSEHLNIMWVRSEKHLVLKWNSFESLETWESDMITSDPETLENEIDQSLIIWPWTEYTKHEPIKCYLN